MPPRNQWIFAPDRGGVRIPETVQRQTAERIRGSAERHFVGQYTQLDIRFRGQFCYIDAYRDPEPLGPNWPPPDWPETREERVERLRTTPVHLCRLRYFGDDERYQLPVFPSGEFLGPPEDAFQASAEVYLS